MVGATQQPQAVLILAADLLLREVAVGEEQGDEVVDDAEPPGLLPPQPRREEEVGVALMVRQEKAAGDQGVDPSGCLGRQLFRRAPRAVGGELGGARRRWKPFVLEQQPAVRREGPAEFGGEALAVGRDAPVAMKLCHAEVDENRERRRHAVGRSASVAASSSGSRR